MYISVLFLIFETDWPFSLVIFLLPIAIAALHTQGIWMTCPSNLSLIGRFLLIHMCNLWVFRDMSPSYKINKVLSGFRGRHRSKPAKKCICSLWWFCQFTGLLKWISFFLHTLICPSYSWSLPDMFLSKVAVLATNGRSRVLKTCSLQLWAWQNNAG
jgi:hypothetical protein